MRGRWLEIAAALIVLGAVVAGGEFGLRLAAEREQAEHRLVALAAASSLGTALNHELSSVLHLSSGLHAYVMTHAHEIDSIDVERMLSFLYGSARHVRNFGIAVGDRLTYVFPREGNEKLIGLRYPELKDQWPEVRKTIETGQRLLVGPMPLAQGGQGLIYRVPVYIEGKYWGLLSTVVDTDSLFASALRAAGRGPFAFAIRGAPDGEVFLGDRRLFEATNAATVDLDLPGGRWKIAAERSGLAWGTSYVDLLRGLIAALGVTLGGVVYMIFRQRRKFSDMALYDGLTGLPNRRLIEDRFERAVVRRKRDRGLTIAMLFIDLDGFKLINDRVGHKAGDAVLRYAAARLSETLRDTDNVGRWGGDEFVVLLEGAAEDRVAELVTRLREAVEVPLRYEGQDLQVGASIGMARMPEDGNALTDLARLADARMYDDKQKRKAER
jgi:diguanylate cyclase (GGDEF)-like protein